MKKTIVIFGVLTAMLLLGLATVKQRSVVDWRTVRAVALESDDWGLAGFVPAADSWRGLDRESLKAGRFPPVYWQSTLEDSAAVARLSGILAAHRGRDGIAAVFQPNYVMGSQAWDQGAGRWVSYELPEWPPQYPRPGMWQAVVEAVRSGVWHPELHAALHYDPALRQKRGMESDLAREVTQRGIPLFPGSERAWELAPWRSRVELTLELDHSLAIFSRVFGRSVKSVIAPDYTWDGWIEDLWQSRRLLVIQAKREQRDPGLLAGVPGRVQKYIYRQWGRLVHSQRVYLERNCRLEPVQYADAALVVEKCLADTRRAWWLGEPAIVETHRVNFSHTDPAVVATGMQSLDKFLAGVCSQSGGPVFLCDSEIAQLMLQGVSWRVAGKNLVLRNASHSARVLVIAGDDLVGLGQTGGGPLWFGLGPQAVRVIPVVDLFHIES